MTPAARPNSRRGFGSTCKDDRQTLTVPVSQPPRLHLVPPSSLPGVERFVRAREEIVVAGGGDAGGDAHRHGEDDRGMGHRCGGQLARDGLGGAKGGCFVAAVEEHCELVASPARGFIAGSLGCFDGPGNSDQSVTAAIVAVLIVDVLQPVDVEQNQGHRFAKLRRPLDGTAVVVVERSCVEQSGQGIGIREAVIELFDSNCGRAARSWRGVTIVTPRFFVTRGRARPFRSACRSEDPPALRWLVRVDRSFALSRSEARRFA